MFSAISILVLACTITVNAQSQCGESKIGIVPTSKPVKLDPVTLAPLTRDWKISVPDVPDCSVSGVTATVCDYDSVPTSYFTDFKTLMVQRTGDLQGYGPVDIIVYCK